MNARLDRHARREKARHRGRPAVGGLSAADLGPIIERMNAVSDV